MQKFTKNVKKFKNLAVVRILAAILMLFFLVLFCIYAEKNELQTTVGIVKLLPFILGFLVSGYFALSK